MTPLIVAAQEAVVPAEEAYAGGPAAPIVTSSEFPDPTKWYRSVDATFSWDLPADITAVSAELSDEAEREPQQTYRPPVSQVEFSASELNEGVQFLLVQFKNADKWGKYSSYRVMIDNTPPEAYTISLTYPHGQRGVVAMFDTSDTLSGLSHFELISNGSSAQVSPAEAKNGYFVPLEAAGTKEVIVKAYDNAGNVREEATSILIMPAQVPNVEDNPLAYAAMEPASVLAAFMAFLALMLFSYMVYERQRYARGLAMLRYETEDVQDEMLKVFSALREEIYDQINTINRKTRLTRKEKEAVDGLNKALDVSEKLLNKEVSDIKKIIS